MPINDGEGFPYLHIETIRFVHGDTKRDFFSSLLITKNDLEGRFYT